MVSIHYLLKLISCDSIYTYRYLFSIYFKENMPILVFIPKQAPNPITIAKAAEFSNTLPDSGV